MLDPASMGRGASGFAIASLLGGSRFGLAKLSSTSETPVRQRIEASAIRTLTAADLKGGFFRIIGPVELSETHVDVRDALPFFTGD